MGFVQVVNNSMRAGSPRNSGWGREGECEHEYTECNQTSMLGLGPSNI